MKIKPREKISVATGKWSEAFKVAGTLINMHNIHNLWSPQKCAIVNAVQTGLCVETTEIKY